MGLQVSWVPSIDFLDERASNYRFTVQMGEFHRTESERVN